MRNTTVILSNALVLGEGDLVAGAGEQRDLAEMCAYECGEPSNSLMAYPVVLACRPHTVSPCRINKNNPTYRCTSQSMSSRPIPAEHVSPDIRERGAVTDVEDVVGELQVSGRGHVSGSGPLCG